MGEVIRFPSAARRKVRNYEAAAQHKAALNFREAHPWPGDDDAPAFKREARRRAERDRELSAFQRTPEMAVMLCLMQSMPAAQLAIAVEAADMMAADNLDDESVTAARALVVEAHAIQKASEARKGGA